MLLKINSVQRNQKYEKNCSFILYIAIPTKKFNSPRFFSHLTRWEWSISGHGRANSVRHCFTVVDSSLFDRQAAFTVSGDSSRSEKVGRRCFLDRQVDIKAFHERRRDHFVGKWCGPSNRKRNKCPRISAISRIMPSCKLRSSCLDGMFLVMASLSLIQVRLR